MKTLIASLITLISMNAVAAQITNGAYEKTSDTLVLDVVYQGGCKDHDFEVRLNACNRMTPADCIAELIDRTEDDACRGIVQKTIRIPAEKVVGSIDTNRLMITGDNESSVIVDLF